MRREKIGFVAGFALVMAMTGWLSAGAFADVKDTGAKAACCGKDAGMKCGADHEGCCAKADAACCAHEDGMTCADACCAHDGKDAKAGASGCCKHGAKDKTACGSGCCKGHETSGGSGK